MAEVLGFIAEVLIRIFLEAVVEGFGYGLKKLWYWLTGQTDKAQSANGYHQLAREKRRKALEQIRQKRQAQRAARRNRKQKR